MIKNCNSQSQSNTVLGLFSSQCTPIQSTSQTKKHTPCNEYDTLQCPQPLVNRTIQNTPFNIIQMVKNLTEFSSRHTLLSNTYFCLSNIKTQFYHTVFPLIQNRSPQKKQIETNENLEQKKGDYGPFATADIFGFIMGNFFDYTDRTPLSSVNKNFRNLLRNPKNGWRVVLTNEHFINNSKEIQFALENDLMVSINYKFYFHENYFELFTNHNDCNKFINYLNDNKELFNKIEVLDLTNLMLEPHFNFQELLYRCSSLKVLKIKQTFPGVLILPKSLTSFFCFDIASYSVLQFSENLKSFGYEVIGHNVTFAAEGNVAPKDPSFRHRIQRSRSNSHNLIDLEAKENPYLVNSPKPKINDQTTINNKESIKNPYHLNRPNPNIFISLYIQISVLFMILCYLYVYYPSITSNES